MTITVFPFSPCPFSDGFLGDLERESDLDRRGERERERDLERDIETSASRRPLLGEGDKGLGERDRPLSDMVG